MRDGHGYSSAELPLYFEWHGRPDGSHPPLLLVHGGGSTIESNWGRLIPALEGSRRMLAVELQGHGRTGAGDRPASFEGSADGVAALLEELAVGPVDILGFSNGGQVAMQLAIRHPHTVRRLVVASAPFRRDGMVDGFWDGLAAGTFADLPQPYRDADLAVSGDPAHTERMFHLDRELMLTGFTDWPDSLVAAITAATLVMAADQDVVRRDHAVRLAGLIPNARLLIVPGNHGDYLGELAAAGDPGPLQRTLPFIVDFLDAPGSTTDAVQIALDALLHQFFAAVSFEPGQRPGYHTIRELFIDDGKLIRNSGEHPEVTTVEQFIEPRQRSVESGELSAFEETETAEITEVFGNVAHRFSTYTKSGVLGGRPFAGAGMISTQFVRTPDGWRISSMAWDDERPGLSIPDRYR